MSVYSEKFILTDKPHSSIREQGFPLDSISIDMKTNKYYYDLTAEELEQAIRGKGAFRRFKDCLFDLGMEETWYKFRDACYEKIAREWCKKYGITVED